MADPAEADLALIPRDVRDKLDRIGIKLHLEEWSRLTLAERRRLVEQPCTTPAEVAGYRDDLIELIRGRTGRAPDRCTTR